MKAPGATECTGLRTSHLCPNNRTAGNTLADWSGTAQSHNCGDSWFSGSCCKPRGISANPSLLRKTVNLLPTVALMAQLSLGALLGLPGVLLALPLVVVLQVVMQKIVVQQVMDRWV